MTWTRSALLVLLAVTLPAPALPPQEAVAKSPIVQEVDGGEAIELRLDEVRLQDFVLAAQPLLGVPVHYQPGELINISIRQPGVERVPRASFRDAFDAVLRRSALLTWDDTAGGSTVITIFRISFPSPGARFLLPFTPPVVTPDELESDSGRRLPFLTVAFPLRHLVARDLLQALLPILDNSLETVRTVEAGNQLVVTASREHLLAVRDLLRTMDVAPSGVVAPIARLEALEQQIADVAARLAKLEAPAR